MCHFTTLIAPSADQKRLNDILQAHRRVAVPTHNPFLAAKLDAGDSQFLTTKGCDCGTVLAELRPSRDAASESDLAKIARLRKRGWSEAKIARSVANQEHARDRAPVTGGTIEMWSDLIATVLADLPAKHAGLFLHWYKGDVATEALQPTLRLARKGEPIQGALKTLNEDEVLIFERSA